VAGVASVAVMASTLGTSPGAPASGATSGTQLQYSSPASIKSQGAGQTSAPSSAAPSDAFASGTLASRGGPYLVDRYGRTVTLHGVNAVYKYAPFELYPDPGQPWNFDASDAKEIAALGFNVVRLGILWEGIEPGAVGANDPSICTPGTPRAPSQFNSTTADAYLAKLTKTVDLLGKYHVYVLLDMHQDVYSQPFRGEGAPAWAICTDGPAAGPPITTIRRSRSPSPTSGQTTSWATSRAPTTNRGPWSPSTSRTTPGSSGTTPTTSHPRGT